VVFDFRFVNLRMFCDSIINVVRNDGDCCEVSSACMLPSMI
jgi:hypothetical protein